jgi:hypothetical protein
MIANDPARIPSRAPGLSSGAPICHLGGGLTGALERGYAARNC